MDDLVQFLRDRYDEAREREEGKRRSVPSPGPFFGHDVVIERSIDKGITVLVDGQPYPEEQYWEIATEPAPDAFILADLDAKRQILDVHKPGRPKGRPNMERGCLACTTAQAWDGTANEANCLTLRLLALPYADHPDYRPEWAR